MPQGSILGHLLFLIFINDLPLSLLERLTQLSLFADDATYFVSNKNVKTIEKDLQICSRCIQSWCRSNHMVTNIDKTKVMLLGQSHPKTKHNYIWAMGHAQIYRFVSGSLNLLFCAGFWDATKLGVLIQST